MLARKILTAVVQCATSLKELEVKNVGIDVCTKHTWYKHATPSKKFGSYDSFALTLRTKKHLIRAFFPIMPSVYNRESRIQYDLRHGR